MSAEELHALINKGKNAELLYMDQVRIALELEYYHRWTIKLEGMLHTRIKDIEEAELDDKIRLSENL